MEKNRLNAKPNDKKKLIRTRSESNRVKILATTAVLVIAALIYYLIDSGSYVATVDGNRISKAEYLYFLSFQKSSTEAENELTNLSQEEKDKFWLNSADGQDPWEEAKRKTLDNSKEVMIQVIKAKEAGLAADSAIKSEVSSLMESYKKEMTDKQFEQQIRKEFKIGTNDLYNILVNLSLVDRFKTSYLSKNFTSKTIADEEIKAYYDKDPKLFDKADIRYVLLNKYDDAGAKLSQQQLDEKKKNAGEALNKINQGEDITKVISEYSEEKASETTPAEEVGKYTLTYSEGSILQELTDWVFENKPGDTDLIDTEYYYFVAKIEKRTGYDEAKATVKTVMENEAREKFYDDTINNWSLEPRFNIIKNDRVYDSISYK